MDGNFSLETGWQFPKNNEEPAVDVLVQGLGISKVLAQLLVQRGVATIEKAAVFLSPRLSQLSDPFGLPDMEMAVSRIFAAIDRNERIVIFGDYDVDGVTSSFLLGHLLQKWNADVGNFIPHRIEEGYGLNADALERCLKEHEPHLFIAIDCGTSAISEIAHLKSKGVDVIVFDHHECGSQLPDCVALVNPKRGGGHDYLCSVGIAFKAAHALLKTRRLEDVDLKEYLDLVALGTVADLVPLLEENRIFVQKGLQLLAETKWPGLRALMDFAGVQAPINTSDIGFKIGPKLNAAGRVGSAQEAFKLLTSKDKLEVREIVASLEEQNEQRKKIGEEVYKAAEAQIIGMSELGVYNKAAIVVGDSGWHPGVLGIVASKLMQKYYKPTIVVGFDECGMGKGSGRSVLGLSLVEALHACKDHLVKSGGHEMAAGLSVEKVDFQRFRDHFEKFVSQNWKVENRQESFVVDCEVELFELDETLMGELEKLGPFGMGNPKPILVARNVEPMAKPKVLKEKHLQLELKQDHTVCRAIWFNGAINPLPNPPWDVAFELVRNTFRGVTSLQLQVRRIRAT